jgi:hypothetical protein
MDFWQSPLIVKVMYDTQTNYLASNEFNFLESITVVASIEIDQTIKPSKGARATKTPARTEPTTFVRPSARRSVPRPRAGDKYGTSKPSVHKRRDSN